MWETVIKLNNGDRVRFVKGTTFHGETVAEGLVIFAQRGLFVQIALANGENTIVEAKCKMVAGVIGKGTK